MLEQLAAEPLISYHPSFTGRKRIDQAFAQRGLHPTVALEAIDADVIKTYVKLGMGVGIIAHMAYEPLVDSDLVALDVSHLFQTSTTRIAFRKGMWLRSFMFDFMQTFAPHLTRARVEAAILADTPEALEQIFANVELPVL